MKHHTLLVSIFLLCSFSTFCADFARDELGRTELHRAAKEGCSKKIKDLAKSILIDAQDKDGWTPLHFATLNLHAKTVKALLKAGASKTITNADGHKAQDILDRLPSSVKEKNKNKFDKIVSHLTWYGAK